MLHVIQPTNEQTDSGRVWREADLRCYREKSPHKIRVCTAIDNRLMFDDFKALMKLHYGQG
jgi:hypothetical protein